MSGLVNTSNQLVNEYRYTPFGTPVKGYPVQGTPNPLQYMARELDALSGLYYVRNRWYDPQQGRFVSEDPIGLAGGVNQYAYAANNPVSARDPLGLYPECVVTWWRGVGYANGYQTGLPQYFPQYSAGCDAEVATVQQVNEANAAMYGRLSGMQPGGGGSGGAGAADRSYARCVASSSIANFRETNSTLADGLGWVGGTVVDLVSTGLATRALGGTGLLGPSITFVQSVATPQALSLGRVGLSTNAILNPVQGRLTSVFGGMAVRGTTGALALAGESALIGAGLFVVFEGGVALGSLGGALITCTK